MKRYEFLHEKNVVVNVKGETYITAPIIKNLIQKKNEMDRNIV